jgi:hypothetical protein
MRTTLQEMDYCADCQKQTLHIYTEQRCNHLFHLLLSLFTGGLWIMVWVFAAIPQSTEPACTLCGSTDTRKPKYHFNWIPD